MSEELEPRNWDITRAYVLLRVTLGLNICLHGVVRWTKGLHSFAESLVRSKAQFRATEGL